MPTSWESLVRYRAAHANDPEWQRVWLFHSHVYFDQSTPESVEQARAFMELIRRTFLATAHVEVHAFTPFPAGPHPCGSFEVLFTREVYAEYMLWLMFERPETLDILVHPLTRSQTMDHTRRAVWLGSPVPLDRTMLEAVDAGLLTLGRSEESIIDGTKKH